MRAARLPALLAMLLLAACGGGGGGGGSAGGGGAGLVVVDSVVPVDGAVDVAATASVTVRFRTPMDGPTLIGGGLTLSPAGTSAHVSASVSVAIDLFSATLTPLAPLEAGRSYQVRLAAEALTASGRRVRRPWFSQFRVAGSGGGGGGGGGTQTGTVRGVLPLEKGRSGHAAAALPDGRVAVFGGFDTDATVTGTIETFDPDPGVEEWTKAGAVLSPPRARATATVLGSGLVLIAGGQSESTTDVGLDRWELWDPALDSMVASGSMQERRTRHRATLLPDGRVLVTGGSRTDTTGAPEFSRTSAEVFDPDTRTWSPLPPMAVPRAGHEATRLADGRVLVTGGHGSDLRAEVFSTGAGSFGPGGSMAGARRNHTAALLASGDVLVCGGGNFTAEVWRAAESRFVQVQNLGDERSHHVAFRLPNGRVFVGGGEKPVAGGATQFHNTIEFYEPADNRFVQSPLRLRAPRSGHSMTVLPGGDLLVVGGKNVVPGEALRSCDRIHLD